MAPTTQTDEPKLTLPSGHPQAGYVENDRSLRDGAGTLPPEEQDAYDEMVALHEEELEAVAQHEHEVATKEREEQLVAAGPEQKPATKATTSKASDAST